MVPAAASGRKQRNSRHMGCGDMALDHNRLNGSCERERPADLQVVLLGAQLEAIRCSAGFDQYLVRLAPSEHP
eukprot:5261823-Alexandrium_andersonii.AAC.1